MLESTRKKEQEVKKETAEQLEVFRKQREAAEYAALQEANAPGDPSRIEQDSWTMSTKKRRRGNQNDAPVLAKVRRRSTAEEGRRPPGASDDKAVLKQDPTLTFRGSQDGVTELASEAPIAKVGGLGHTPQHDEESKASTSPPVPTTAKSIGLGLGAYGSDED